MSPRGRQRAVALAALVFELVLVGATAAVAARRAPGERPYIVVLRDDADPQTVAREHATAYGLVVTHVYEHALKGYAARIPAGQLAAVRSDPRVRYVEEDGTARALGAASRP